jgi:hypothetical protein
MSKLKKRFEAGRKTWAYKRARFWIRTVDWFWGCVKTIVTVLPKDTEEGRDENA